MSPESSDVAPGRVLFLNGTSSSGKSTIARALPPLLDGTWFVMSVDDFGAMRQDRPVAPDESAEILRRTRAGFHRAVAGMAAAGNNVVVDHVLSEQWRLDDCLAVLEGLDVVFVGVRCDPDELDRRERARGDRPVGLAVAQLEQVHRHGRYDVEVDTSTTPATDCAARIATFVAGGGPARAFARLRQE